MQSRQLIFAVTAEKDLTELSLYWCAVSPDRAREFLLRFRQALANHAAMGLIGSPTHQIAPNIRGFIFGDYIAILRPTNTTLEVIRVFHTARNVADLLGEPPS